MKSASPRPSLQLATSTANPRQSAGRAVPMSQVNAFDGRGRNPAAARYRPMPLRPLHRDTFRAAWARAMQLVFRSRERCAADMDVTFQTACNWWDEFSTPTGDKVAQFSRDYPEAYSQLLREVAA